MFQLDVSRSLTLAALRPPPYAGPERRGTPAAWRWLAAMLDEIDYGMLLLVDESQVVHANHVARAELDSDHPLQLLGSELRLRCGADVARLRAALADAAGRGLRRLLTLGEAGAAVTVAVVPLRGGDGRPATLLVFGKRQVCEHLSAQGYARCHGLTAAESRVLELLCDGETPAAIARRQRVAMSTVRTQIGAIRAKTGAASIREVVRQVAVLPPLIGALRSVPARPDGAAAGLAACS